MGPRVRILVEAGGPVAVKTAATPEEVAQLAYEATRLRRAAHPGVVALLDHRVMSATHAELRTRPAGRSLEAWQGDLANLAGIGAAVAATLADLHELGIVHGRLDTSHVLVGLDGRPRLCGFGALDPGVPAGDVAALGHLLDELARRVGPERPGTLQWRRGPVAERRAFEQLIVQATNPAVERRPSARSLAGALLVAVPDAELPPAGPWVPAPAAVLARQGLEPEAGPTDDDPAAFDEASGPVGGLHFDDGLDAALDGDEDDDAWVTEVLGDQSDTSEEELFGDRPWSATPRPIGPPRHVHSGSTRRPARLAVAAVAGATVVVALTAFLVRDPDPPPSPPDEADAAAAEPTTTTTDDDAAAAASEDTTATPRCAAGTPAPEGDETADVDGDGCTEAFAVRDGVVQAGRDRWAVGEPGDLVAVGDWDCDGDATPAVYRPTSGDVFVFDAWATAGHPLAAEPTTQVPGGAGLTVVREGDCDAPVVTTAAGERHRVAVER